MSWQATANTVAQVKGIVASTLAPLDKLCGTLSEDAFVILVAFVPLSSS